MQQIDLRKKACGILLICLLLLSYCLIPKESFATIYQPEYLNSLLKIAKSKKLHRQRYWDALIHYKPSTNGKISLIDDPSFFLATDGKTNPDEELIYTIKSFFEIENNQNGRCRFPARYEWLKNELPINENFLPPLNCQRMKIVPDDQSSLKAVLVYPVSYMGGVETMFGHTMLRIDSDERNPLLSLSISYSAFTRGESLISHIHKGLTGGFKGYYYLWPYYVKLKEYADMEERDIWEYELNLSSNEVYRMLLHIMELNDIYSDYFFLDENCSFNLFPLLEVARPSLTLLSDYWVGNKYWVIPSDTVRMIYDKKLVTSINYRTSLKTILNNYSIKIPDELLELAYALATKQNVDGELARIENLRIEQQGDVLDAASKLVQYNYSKLKMSQYEFQDAILRILKKKEDFNSVIHEARTEIPNPPHEGHASSRISLGGGYKFDSPYSEIGWRPAYHDFTDPMDGYSLGNRLNFLDTVLRYYEKSAKLELQKLNLIDFLFLQNRTYFFKPLSWKLGIGFEQYDRFDENDPLVFHLTFGSGLSWFNNSLGLFYGFINVDLFGGSALGRGWELNPGIELGARKQIRKGWEIDLNTSGRYNLINHTEHFSWDIKLNNIFHISKNKAICVTYEVYKTEHQNMTSDIKLNLRYYF